LTSSSQVYIAAIEGYVPKDIICTFRAFLEFCYLVRRNIITEQTLIKIDDALERFHRYREVFRNAEVVTSFSLPQQHSMKHYHHLICQFGAPNGLCSSITESKHIKAVKRPYRHTNRFQALGQMLLINQQLDKLSAARTDFQECGTLDKSYLSHALEALGEYASSELSSINWHLGQHANEADHQQNMQEEADEQTASYEEDLGETIDTPTSIEAHISLAQTYRMLSLLPCTHKF